MGGALNVEAGRISSPVRTVASAYISAQPPPGPRRAPCSATSDYFEIDDTGSCYPKNLFNPRGYRADEYYDALAEQQRAAADAAAAEQTSREQPPKRQRV